MFSKKFKRSICLLILLCSGIAANAQSSCAQSAPSVPATPVWVCGGYHGNFCTHWAPGHQCPGGTYNAGDGRCYIIRSNFSPNQAPNPYDQPEGSASIQSGGSGI